MTTVLRPMSTGELLDRTFFLYRKHFALFFGIAALPNLVVLAAQIAGAAFLRQGLVATNAVWSLVTAIIYLVALAATQAATVVGVSAVHLERPITVSGAFAAVRGKLLKVIGIMIGVSIGVGFGFVLLIVPGIIFALMWALAVPVAVLENKGLSASTSRSAQLTKGNRGRIFVVGFLFLVLLYMVALVLELPIFAIIGASAPKNAAQTVQMFGWMQVVGAVVTFITQSLVYPLLTIALALIYYDERVRKEAFDIQLMMTTLDGRKAHSATATA